MNPYNESTKKNYDKCFKLLNETIELLDDSFERHMRDVR